MTLQLNNVSKFFHQGQTELRILQNVDLELVAGEIVAVIGESGSGKSTMLSLLAGFERPDSGQLLWQKQNTLLWSEDQWANFRRESLGFVFQHYHLIPYLTAAENVALPLRLNHQAEPDLQARELLARLGLAERSTHLPNQLSGGESQRVAIARALIHKPRLVLADEPTGSLDVRTGTQVLDLLFGLLSERTQTALIVTHSSEVAARCHRVLTLRQGKLWPA